MINLSEVLAYKWPDAQWSLNGESYAGLDWHDSIRKPSKTSVTKATKEYEQYVKDNEYKELRRAAYASTQDQFDMMYHDAKNGTSTWLVHVTDVKERYPKPDSINE